MVPRAVDVPSVRTLMQHAHGGLLSESRQAISAKGRTVSDDLIAAASFVESFTPAEWAGLLAERTSQRNDALAENERLKVWKAEATEVMKGWVEVWVAMGAPGPLGGMVYDNALKWVTGQRVEVERLKVERDRRDEVHRTAYVRDLQGLRDDRDDLLADVERLKAELDELKAEHDVAFDRALAKTREAHDLRAENERLDTERIDALGKLQATDSHVDLCHQRIKDMQAELRALRAAVGGLSPEAVEWAVRIGIAYTRVVYDDTEANNHAVIAAYQLCPPEVRAQIMQGELT